jgi:hypothetical protein
MYNLLPFFSSSCTCFYWQDPTLLTLYLQILIVTLKQRKRRWGIFRSHISSRAKAQFTYLLSERSFRGRLLTDHEGKLLDLQVWLHDVVIIERQCLTGHCRLNLI